MFFCWYLQGDQMLLKLAAFYFCGGGTALGGFQVQKEQ